MTDETKKIFIDKVFTARKNRTIHPDGHFDSVRRWVPTLAEDAEDITHRVRTPSRAWPYSYMTACRTRKHCAILVERFLAGLDVPCDVINASGGLESK
jgi:hypothetical protein